MERTALSTVFERVKPPTTFEETVARLGTAIRLGVLPPGARLPPERELAEQLGISRSTLRQALKTLTESGHLVAVRGRTGGTFVADQPPIAAAGKRQSREDSWRDLLDYRVAVELGAVQLAAERATEADLERLTTQVQKMAGELDWFEYRRADVAFHLALAEVARSPRLLAAMTEMQGSLNDLFDKIAHPSTMLEAGNDQHLQILEALRAHDSAAAVGAMREHLVSIEHIVEGLLP